MQARRPAAVFWFLFVLLSSSSHRCMFVFGIVFFFGEKKRTLASHSGSFFSRLSSVSGSSLSLALSSLALLGALDPSQSPCLALVVELLTLVSQVNPHALPSLLTLVSRFSLSLSVSLSLSPIPCPRC